MIKVLLKSRYIALTISFFMFLNSIAFLIMGVIRGFQAYKEVIHFMRGHHEVKPGLHIAESLDTFLIAIVTLIISIGIAKIFFLSDEDSAQLPKWLDIHSFKDLKILLWETILLTLVVLFLTILANVGMDFSWKLLIIPISILLLSISLILMKGKHPFKH